MCKRFGGLLALDHVSLTAEEGSVTALIGPNGAGKTTLFAIISGFVRPSEGSVLYAGVDITREAPHARARRGIARSFQLVQPFAELTVQENIAVGSYLTRPARSDALAAAADIAQLVGLDTVLHRLPRTLTLAALKRLELARALAIKPRLLLLDEILAGLNPSEIRDVVPVIRAIRDRGVAIVLIEHVMQAVMSLAEEIVVLAEGRIIARGSPRAVVADPEVVHAYFGRGTAARMLAQSAAPPPERGRACPGLDPGSATPGFVGASRVEVKPAVRSSPNAQAARRTPARPLPLLMVSGLCAGYAGREVLHEVDLSVAPGELVAVLGSNGAGKSTLNRAISGVLKPSRGAILFANESIGGAKPGYIVERGLIHIPEGRRIFPALTVRENLDLGAYRRARLRREANRDRVFTLFPRLAERRSQRAGTLSGGEQQMLAIGRGLMGEPRLLILDEPSLGLSPVLVEHLFALVRSINAEGIAVVLVEQNVVQTLELVQRAYVLENGRLIMHGSAAQIRDDPKLSRAYLGL
jgi:branched-chain amino acid transport system ATP-binding protein